MNEYNLRHKGSNRADLLSKTITFIKFPLAVLVVILHCDLSTKQYELIGISQSEIMNPLYANISWFLSRYVAFAAVPCFFVISGFLLFYNVNNYSKEVYFRKLKKRFKTLLIPYLSWNLIYLFLYWLIGQDKMVLSEVPNLFTKETTFIDFILTVFVRPIDGPLWFIRNLIAMVVLSPVLYFIIKKTSFILPFSLLVLTQFVHSPIIESFLWFSFGISFAVKKIDYLYFCNKWLFIILSVTILSVVLDYFFISQTNFHITRYFAIFKIMSIFGIAYLCAKRFPSCVNHPILNNSSFTLYAYHGLAVITLLPFIYGVFTNKLKCEEVGVIITYFLSIILIVIIGIILSVLINKEKLIRSLLTGR